MTIRCADFGRVAGAAVLAALALAPRSARADYLACIEASGAEAPLQKSAHPHEVLTQAAPCADPNSAANVKAECPQRIVNVNAAIPTVERVAAHENGSVLPAVRVTLNGKPLADGESRSGKRYLTTQARSRGCTTRLSSPCEAPGWPQMGALNENR